MLFLQCPRCAKPLPGHANYCRRCGCPVRPASPSVTPARNRSRNHKSGRGWFLFLALMVAFFAMRSVSTRHHRTSTPTPPRMVPAHPLYITNPPVEVDHHDSRRSVRPSQRVRPFDNQRIHERTNDRTNERVNDRSSSSRKPGSRSATAVETPPVEREYDFGH